MEENDTVYRRRVDFEENQIFFFSFLLPGSENLCPQAKVFTYSCCFLSGPKSVQTSSSSLVLIFFYGGGGGGWERPGPHSH